MQELTITATSPEVHTGTWHSDLSSSYLSFITTKQTNVTEVHTFENFSASLDPAGNATLVIDLGSVATNVDLRDERVCAHVFESSLFPSATATFPVDMGLIDTLPVGESVELPVEATLDFHGVSQPLSFTLWVSRLTAAKLTVGTTKPIVLDALAFNLGAGIDTLVEMAGLASIGSSIPVELMFTLNRY